MAASFRERLLERVREWPALTWPAIVAAQRLAFRILAACWDMEATGARAVGAGEIDSLVAALDAAKADADLDGRKGFLWSEIATQRAALASADLPDRPGPGDERRADDQDK